MKKIMLTTVTCLLVLTLSFAGNAPAAVKQAFAQKFPNATAIKWDKENAHEYEASFTFNGEKHSANFSDSGEWLETESAAAFNQLPDKVKSAFTASHKKTRVKAAAKIETAKGVTKYEVEFKKGLKTIELFYNADGTALEN